MGEERPVLTGTLLAATAATVIDLVVAFGAPVTADQQQAILAFIPAAWLLCLAIYGAVRPRIVSRARAAILVGEASHLTADAVDSRRRAMHTGSSLVAVETLPAVEDRTRNME